jgi:GAF domain-containing protein
MSPTHGNDDGGHIPSAMTEGAAYAALSRISLTGRALDQTLAEVAVLAKRALPENPEASVTLLTEDHPRTAAFSGEPALQLDERQYGDGFGPCLDAAVSGGVIPVTMDGPDSPYPDFRRLAQQQGVTHSLSVGLPAAGRTIGALNLYTTTVHGFSDESVRIAGTFAGFAGIILATLARDDETAATAHQLQQALESRAVISQAQGILIAQHHCNRDHAFALLLRLAQQQGLKLRQAAQALVDQTTS